MRVAVVGGGVVGLTTALQLEREIRNCSITVYAESYDDLVSYVAAGLFRPGVSYSGPTEEITRKWINDSYDFYEEIRRSRDSAIAGVVQISGYHFANSGPNSVKNPWLETLVPAYRRVTDDEFNLVGGNWKYGVFYTTLLTQCKFYIPWAKKQLEQRGAKFYKKKIFNLSNLIDDHDVIINCCGLGARDLCGDRRMVPLRGQIAKVKAPWLKTFFYGEVDTYIIPGVDGQCTLGGTRNYDSTRSSVCPYEAKAIRHRCESLVPSLKNAETGSNLVGLRPHRDGGVRVETERVSNGRRVSTIVHNYGHGGYGVCTAPGTSKYALKLAQDTHRYSGSKL